MTRDTDTENDAGLERLFDAARDDAPDAGLVARVLVDAEAAQPAQSATVHRPVVRRRGWLAGVVETLGGWGAVGGVTAAGIMGLSIGLYAPETVVDWVGGEALGVQFVSDDFTPDMADLWLEGDDV
ncbi:hypothetical protein [Gymnodinialimonas ulvae]|uniref:hypothetical protein n=1 Tax=Gymnodinialimonas ulvae TaxID=3126504 RepID=UPI0030A43993